MDSDDLFHKDVTKTIQSFGFLDNRALWFSQGYVFNTETEELNFWEPRICPPFYTVLFKAEDFFNPATYFSKMVAKLKAHHEVPKVFNAKKLEGRKYLVTINGKNIATKWSNAYKGESISERREKEKILKDFGL